MKVAGSKIAGGALILVGLLWLVSLFLNPSTWRRFSSNQLNGTRQQQSSGVQRFTTNNGTAPLAAKNQTEVEQGKVITDESGRRVEQANQSLNYPDQSASPSPSPAQTKASPSPEPAFEPTPQPTPEPTPQPTPQQTVVPEPVRAGW